MTTQQRTVTRELEAALDSLGRLDTHGLAIPAPVIEAAACIERAIKLLQTARCEAVAQLDRL
jgi:hypothetical protein